MDVNLADMYVILAAAARNGGQLTYTQLSQKYFDRTGDWHEPHGSWDLPLGELNRDLHVLRWPPLSAVVVLKETQEPGGLFWESSSNIPSRPSNDIAQIAAYSQILGQVHAAHWTDELPTSARS